MVEAQQPARVPLDVDVECRSDELSSPLRYRAVNIGEGGLFLKSTRPLPVGTRVHCTFSLPDDPEEMHVETEVAWTRSGPADQIPPPGMGLTFLGIAVDDLDRLQLYVDSFEAVEEGMGPDVESVPDQSGILETTLGQGKDPVGPADEEVIDLVAPPAEVSMMPPPPPESVAPGTGTKVATFEEAHPERVHPSPREDTLPTGPAAGGTLTPGDALHVVMERVLVEGRVVGVTEDGVEIVGGWSEADISLQLDSGEELTGWELVELAGLGAGRVRIRLDGTELHRRVQAFEPPPPPAEPGLVSDAVAPEISLSGLEREPLVQRPAEPGLVSDAVAPEISLSGLEQAPLVPRPAAEDAPEEGMERGTSPRALLHKALGSKAAVTLLSCLLLVGAGAGVAALLGGKGKTHGKTSSERRAGAVGEASGQQGRQVADSVAERSGRDQEQGATASPAGKPSESRPAVVPRGTAPGPAGPVASRRTTPSLKRGRNRVRGPGLAVRDPRLAPGGRAVRHSRPAVRPGGGAVSRRSERSIAKVGLAVRRRSGRVSLLLGVTGTAKKLSSYWLAKPPGVVVDMTGVRSRVRPGNHKVADSQVRFVKVLRRPGGVRFIVYMTSRDAAAAARVHSAPGLGVVTWPGKTATSRRSEKLSMR